MGQEIDSFKEAAVAQMKAAFGIPPLRRVTAQLAAVAAGDYAALDIISANVTDTTGRALKVNGLALTAGDVATIYKVVLRSNDASLLARVRLHFFDRALVPADAELDDNAAFTITTFDAMRAYLGYIDIPAVASRSAGTFAQADGIRQEFKTRGPLDLNGDGALFMVIQLLDAEANEAAGMLLEFDFYVA